MDVSHNFRFHWNDHVPHLSQIFSELRFEEVYCDTTLISDDGFVLKAHGAVLSATSRYFERVLSGVTADQHPIIVLKGANFVELSCLLDYIYQGATQVDQHLMEAVLDAADMLEIKGLSKMKNNLSIKKLIAPTPHPTPLSRNSPICSLTSKSPLQSPPTSRSHSPCCLSPTDDSLLKVDTDTNDDERDSLLDTKAPLNETVESQDYSILKHGPNSEHSDQTLGIDLSLSRAANTETEKTSQKIFTSYDDTPLRKRKVMVEESVLHKKMKLLTRSDENDDSDINIQFNINQNPQPIVSHGAESRGKFLPSTHESFVKDWQETDAEIHKIEHQKDPKSEIDYLDDDFQVDSVCYGEAGNQDESKSFITPTLARSEVCSPRCGTQNPCILKSKSNEFNSQTPATLAGLQILRKVTSPRLSPQDVWVSSGIMSIKRPTVNSSTGRKLAITFPNEDIPKYVSVQSRLPKLGASNFRTQSMFKQQKQETVKAFEAIDEKVVKPVSKIKRPLSMYSLFLKENYGLVCKQNPHKKNCEIIRIVGQMWKELPKEQKNEYAKRANELLVEFRAEHPGYTYCPNVARANKQEFHRKKIEKKNLFRRPEFQASFRTEKRII